MKYIGLLSILRSVASVLLCCLGTGVLAQNVTVTGRVIDADTEEPIPFASIALVEKESEDILAGSTTGVEGNFEIRSNSFEIIVKVSFIGYEDKTISDFTATGDMISLGDIRLKSTALGLEEVEITAEKSSMEFKLDKRVFNVGKDLSSTGMGALEVLDNVPSVNVDIEGQVSLRGNGGVQILINGKPSILADSEGNALGSITADMIERIEVITNPSAKYEAEGTAGIINIVLKKEEKKGLNGSVSLNTGIPENHSVGGSMNYRTDDFNFFTQFGAGYRSLPRYRESENRDLTTGTAIITDGTEYRNELFYNITLGSDYYLTDKDIITLSGSFAFEDEDQPSETEFAFIGENGQVESRWLRNETTEADNPKYQFELQYRKEFENNEDHQLLVSAQGNFFGKEQSSEFINTPLLNTEVDPNQRTATDFYERRYVFRLDYTNPFTENLTLETGALFEVKDVGNEFEVFNEIDGVYVPDSNFINNFEYDQDVLGIYGTLAYEKDRWGLKIGLRGEHTYLRTELVTTNEVNNRDFTNLFPSVHSSYEFSEAFSLQAGYSRRIYRPRLWDLNPFFNIRNNYNIRQGNPELLPEFSDSYELTGILLLGSVSLNSSLYYLFTDEVIERVTFSENNVNITRPINLGTRDKFGIELNGKYSTTNWLTFNWDFNWGYFLRNGTFEETSFDYEDDQWSGELTTKIKMPSDLELEFAVNYQSGFETVQGNVSGIAFANGGLRKKFLDGKIVVNFGVRDIFNSRIRESFARQPNFSFYDYSRRGTFYTLGVSYGFGKGEAMTYSGRRR